MKQIKLNASEMEIENALISGEYLNVDRIEFDEIARSIAGRKKDSVLNIRINRKDLKSLKSKAKRYGIGYQTFLSELIHRVAQG